MDNIGGDQMCVLVERVADLFGGVLPDAREQIVLATIVAIPCLRNADERTLQTFVTAFDMHLRLHIVAQKSVGLAN